jgi:glycosyltransferase involved in cell wall biosynthesis
MKIVYIIEGTYNSGGMERVLCSKANRLAEHGYDITVVTTEQQERPPFFDFDPRIRMVDLGIGFEDAVEGSFFKQGFLYLTKQRTFRARLSRFLAGNPADVVVSMFGREVHWLPKLRDGSKKIAEIHFSKSYREQKERRGLWRLSDMIRTRSDERAARKYRRFVVLTHEDMESWGDRPNMRVIHNATPFMPATVAPLTGKQAIAVGRLNYHKGYERMISAWEIVHRTHPDWKLAIYGGGDERETLMRLVASAGLQDVITLFPPTADIAERYMESSLLVLSSRYEGFGLVLLEAMACGVPAVAFACKCGPRDIIASGVDGVLVEEGDIEGLAEGIIRLIEDEPLRKRLGGNARKTVEDRFTEQAIMPQWVELFEGLKD